MEEARKNCDLAIQEYKDALEKIFMEHQEAKRRQEELEIKTETEHLIRENNKRFSEAQVMIKGTLTRRQSELKDKLFVEVRDMLARYFETPEYHRQLVKEFKEALDFARGEEVILYVDPSDAERVPSLKVEVGAPITVSRYSFIGGTRAVIPGRHILIDNSFETKLSETKENFQIKGGEGRG